MRVMIELGRTELNALQYPIIVEGMCNGLHGRVKRGFEATFTERERRLIREYYRKFYGWCFRTGTPRAAVMRISTYDLLKRAADFFAGA